MSTRSNLDISSSVKSFRTLFPYQYKASMMTVVTPLSMKIASLLDGCFSVKETKLSTTLAFVANFTAPLVGIVNEGGGSATSPFKKLWNFVSISLFRSNKYVSKNA